MGIKFNRDFDPDYGQSTELGPQLRRVVANNPNPFTFTGTGVYVVGRGEVAVIDPGPSIDEHLDAVMAALQPGERVTKILVTHTHTDHTAGVAKLQARTGAVTYGFGPHGPTPEKHPLEGISFDEFFTPAEAEAFTKAWNETPEELRREGPDHDFVPDVSVGDGDVIDGDGWSIEVVHTPGHTSNHVCFALSDHQGIGSQANGSPAESGNETELFTGDHVMGWATSVISPPDGDLFDYMSSLEKLLERSDVRYWPTHGAPIENPQEFVRSFIAHRTARERQIIEHLRAGPASIKELVPPMYAEVDKRLWRAAANSVYSHLLALQRQGRASVQRNTDDLGHLDRWVLTEDVAPQSPDLN